MEMMTNAAIIAVQWVVVISAATQSAGESRPLFRVHTKCDGLDYVNISGSKDQLPIIEQNGQGIGLLDYDGDGWLDVFVTNGGTLENWRRNNHPGCRLFRNLGGWKFMDATARAGVAGRAWSNGCAAADYDEDGDMDLYVTNWGANVLYRNNGEGTFTDVTDSCGVGDRRWSSSAAFADFNGDGRLDIHVTNYVEFDPDHIPAHEADGSPCRYRGIETGCGPWCYKGQRDTLYVQRADGTFDDASESWGMACTEGYRGMGLAPGDFDGDGDVDVYIGCDVMPNLYLENVNQRGLRSVGMVRGGALNADGNHESGMGVAAADLFRRGELDILTTNFVDEKNTYYRNVAGYFEDRSAAIGFDAHRMELGWGLAVADFNQDGFEDVFVASGHIYPQVDRLDDPLDRYEQSPRLYLGTGQERLAELPPERAFAPGAGMKESVRVPTATGDRTTDKKNVATLLFSLRAVACGDLDNDGDLDVVAVRHNGPLVIFENLSDRPAAVITLQTVSGGASPHGAHVTVGNWHHFHFPTQGYQCSHDPRVFLAQPKSEFGTVRWMDGKEERFAVPQPGGRALWRAGRGMSIKETSQ